MRDDVVTDESSHEYRLFRRREKAVRAGQRLPTEEELLRGMLFFREELREDVREFGERLARRLRRRQRTDLAPLVTCLEELTVEQGRESVAALEAALLSIPDAAGLPLVSMRLRCLLYRAGFGDPDAAAAIAGEMAVLALRDLKNCKGPRLLWTSLGWSAFSRDLVERDRADVYRNPSHSIDHRYELLSYSRQFKEAIRRFVSVETEKKREEAAVADAVHDPEVAEQPASTISSADTIVVLREVGNASVSQGKQVAKEFETIVGCPLPLPRVPELATVRARLAEEFPYADAVVDDILKGLVGRAHVWLRPTIFVGPPGCGKSRFARRLAEEIGAPHVLIPCGGMSDSGLGGTARRWSSGEPSLPILVVRRHRCAGPLIILDEIEKVGTGRHNGNVHDVLLGLFERETSTRWQDPYVQADCDLSNVSWLMTANQVEPIPAVLRDRCRVIRFPQPGPGHLPALARRILERLYADQGHDARWATPLEGYELEAIASAWGGGSIRKLERLVEQLIEVRDREGQLQ